jgi:predicted transcriptional regulator
MELHLTGELEAKLTHSAAQQGRNPDELVQDVLTRYLEEEARFIEAVKHGEDALERGEYLTHEQVGERLDRLIRDHGSTSGNGSTPKVPILHLGPMGPLHRREVDEDAG